MGCPVEAGERHEILFVTRSDPEKNIKKGEQMRTVSVYESHKETEPINYHHYITNELKKQVTKILNIAYAKEISEIEDTILDKRDKVKQEFIDKYAIEARDKFFRKKYAQFMSATIKEEASRNRKIAKEHGEKAVAKLSSRVKYFEKNKHVVHKLFEYTPTKSSVTNARRDANKLVAKTDKTYTSKAFIENMAKYMKKKSLLGDQICDPNNWPKTMSRYHNASYC